MSNQNYIKDRQSLLADIAEIYFFEEKTWAEMAEINGVSRSNVSQMLAEAKNSGIVLINIKSHYKKILALKKN